jgi:hypothetical protein
MSLVGNLARTWRRPAQVVRELDDQGLREPQLLFFALLACGLIYVAQWPGLSRAAAIDPSVSFEQRMGGALFAVMFLLPLVLYGLAGVVQVMLRLFAAPVHGLRVRLALFWALLSVTPLMLLQGGLSAFLGAGPFVTLFGFVVLGCFLYILGAGLWTVVRLTQGSESDQ